MNKASPFLKYTILAVIVVFMILAVIEGLNAFYTYQQKTVEESKPFTDVVRKWNYHPENGKLQNKTTNDTDG